MRVAVLATCDRGAHLVPAHGGDPMRCKAWSDMLLKHHRSHDQPISFPTGPRGTERLGFAHPLLHDLS
jgi:5-aminolevulinate synthase